MTTPERDVCDRARQALEGVTPGPWESSYNPMDTSYPADYYTVITEREGDHIAEVDDEKRAEEHEGPHGKFGRDAHFIAAARTLVPELVAEVERLRQERRDASRYLVDTHNARANLLRENAELQREVERLRANQRVETVEDWHSKCKGSN